MTETAFSVRALPADEAHEKIPALTDVLLDCVEGGASVTFMRSLTRAKAQEFWHGVAEGVAADKIVLLIAEDSAKHIVGTVQVMHASQDNQPHRADVAKMLVRRSARRQGAGARLMQAAEDAARTSGKTLLVLDTVSDGDASRLYQSLGWIKVGVIPGYALDPDGRLCATTYYYKSIA